MNEIKVAGGIIASMRIKVIVIISEYLRKIADIKSTFISAGSSSVYFKVKRVFRFFFINSSVIDLLE